jgi:hypothetical protein
LLFSIIRWSLHDMGFSQQQWRWNQVRTACYIWLLYAFGIFTLLCPGWTTLLYFVGMKKPRPSGAQTWYLFGILG